MSEPVVRLDVTPSYTSGFLFRWDVDPAFQGTPPWSFYIERAETHTGPWTEISPVQTDLYMWAGPGNIYVVNRDPNVMFFRVRMMANGNTYYSLPITPYGSLERRDFLLVQEIQRKELLMARVQSGVPGQIFLKSLYGPACPLCRDFVTGESTTENCSSCYGTGRVPGYHGPYPGWFVFNPERRSKGLENDNQGVHEHPKFNIRLIGFPRLKKDDVIVDSTSDRRYYVDTVVAVAEIRRIPIVQDIVGNEITRTSAAYKLGTVA